MAADSLSRRRDRRAGGVIVDRATIGRGVVALQAPTLGFLLLGLSGALLLVTAARVHQPSVFTAVGLIWTVSTVFGVGVAIPFEQVVTRRLTAGAHEMARLAFLIVGSGVVFGLAVVTYAEVADSDLSSAWALTSALLCIATWCVLAPGRARLTSRDSLVLYGACLLVEASARVLIVAAALTLKGDLLMWLGAAVWGPMFLAAAFAWACPAPGARRRVVELEAQGSFFLVALGFQACINGPVLVLGRGTGSAGDDHFGQFLAASTYFRSPALILGGLALQLLVGLGREGRESSRGQAIYCGVVRSAWGTIGLSTVLAVALSPWLLTLYRGQPMTLSWSVQVALAVGTVLACVAYLMLQSALVLGRGWAAGAVWLGAGASSILATLSVGRLSAGPWDLLLSGALVSGPVAAFLGGWAVSQRAWTGLNEPPDVK